MKVQQADQLKKKDGRLQKIIESIVNLKIIKLQVSMDTIRDLVGIQK
jgi:hypothetical protein